jgi:hypothetical protein
VLASFAVVVSDLLPAGGGGRVRPTRTAKDLVGKRIIVHDRLLVPQAKRRYSLTNPAWVGRTIQCTIRAVRTDKEGKLIAIYVTKEGLKTKIRISVEDFTPSIQRYRAEGQTSFRWRVRDGRGHTGYSISVVRMSRKQRGCNSKEFQAPTIAWWLNNPDVLEQNICRPRVDHKDGRPPTQYLRDPITGRLPSEQ